MKWLETEIELINPSYKELMGKELPAARARIKLDTSKIIAVREQVGDEDESQIDPNICVVYLSSGEYFALYTPYKTVSKLVDPPKNS